MFEAIGQITTTPQVQGSDVPPPVTKPPETPAAQKTTDVSSSGQTAQEQKRTREQAQQVTEETLQELEQDIESMHSVGLRFAKFDDLDRTYVKVIDKTNDEVIRQIPSEDVLKLAAKMEEMIGILFDKQV